MLRCLPILRCVQGIELYKENLALCERLNTYYAAMQNLPALRYTQAAQAAHYRRTRLAAWKCVACP